MKLAHEGLRLRPRSHEAVVSDATPSSAPVCVDLDGTFLRTDTLHEQVLLLARRNPLLLLLLPFWLWHGKAALKRRLAQAVRLEADSLPVNERLLDYLRAEHARGRELALVSAADDSIVQAVAARYPLFSWVRGSDGVANLDGARKLAAIQERYGDRFVYAGNGPVDLRIWPSAEAAIVAGDGRRLLRKVEALVPVERTFFAGPEGLAGRSRTWIKALRLHQWAKNLLLFVPVLLGGPLITTGDFLEAVLGFLIFGALASAGYVVNDLLDLTADRRHKTKCRRPFAAGEVPIQDGILGAACLVAAAALLCLLMPWQFSLMALVYFGGTLSYSLLLKREPMLDVLALAGLFSVRVFAGAVILPIPVSFWLLSFSMFLFLSLALVKRYAELHELAKLDAAEAVPGRGYTVPELPLLLAMGSAAAVAANVIFLLYLIEEKFPSGIYLAPQWLWLIFPILMYWLLRLWRLAVQGRMDEDPVFFAIKDRVSLLAGALVLGLVLLAR